MRLEKEWPSRTDETRDESYFLEWPLVGLFGRRKSKTGNNLSAYIIINNLITHIYKSALVCRHCKLSRPRYANVVNIKEHLGMCRWGEGGESRLKAVNLEVEPKSNEWTTAVTCSSISYPCCEHIKFFHSHHSRATKTVGPCAGKGEGIWPLYSATSSTPQLQRRCLRM